MAGNVCLITSIVNNNNNNNQIKITNFRVDGNIEHDSFTIKYEIKSSNNFIFRHYIYINGEKKEITKEVGYENQNNIFSYTLNNLIPNTLYTVQIEIASGLNTITSYSLPVTTSYATIYGVSINNQNSNSETSLSYIDDAINIVPAFMNSLSGWKNKFPYNKIELVGFKNGQETETINPLNKKQYSSGKTVPHDVDVMVKIPKLYWKTTSTSTGFELRISHLKLDGYDCYAHKVGGVEKDYIYVGSYLGHEENGKLRSISGVYPTVNKTIGQFRELAQANGKGYQQLNWNTLILLRILYLISYKNLNSQIALGEGYTANRAMTSTGNTDTKGFIYGSDNNQEQICFLGIEDLWGNLRQWVDGIFISNSYQTLITRDNINFNDDAAGYKGIGTFNLSNSSGIISSTANTNQSLFLPTEFYGSAYSNFSDFGSVSLGSLCFSGGSYSDGINAGIFCLFMDCRPSESYFNLGSRLCYLG